jgi:uncharacterized protein (TIGR03067 family)
VTLLSNLLISLSVGLVIVVIWAMVYTRRTGKPFIVWDSGEPDHDPADLVENVSLESLQGTWRMVSVGRNGNFAPQHVIESANVVMKIDGNKLRMVDDQTGAIFTLNHDVVPNQMNQIADDGDEHLCVIRFRNYELEICQGEPGKPRPTNFRANRRDGASLTRFKRIA